MNHSPISDLYRQNSPTFVHFINKTLYSTSLDYSRIATTRKLTNMNKQKSSTLGVIQLSLLTSDNHLTLKSKFEYFVFFFL
jgi:hypothetical protein